MWHRNDPPLPQKQLISHSDDLANAKAAQRASTERFLEAVDKAPEVRRLSEASRRLRVNNGFDELLEKSMRLR